MKKVKLYFCQNLFILTEGIIKFCLTYCIVSPHASEKSCIKTLEKKTELNCIGLTDANLWKRLALVVIETKVVNKCPSKLSY